MNEKDEETTTVSQLGVHNISCCMNS